MTEFSARPTTDGEAGGNEQSGTDAMKEACARVSTVPSNDSSAHPRRLAHSWQPSIFRIRPWIGLLALGVSTGCMFASLGILLGSRDQPINEWYFQPTVYLAIATAVSNTALNAALAQAAPIRWWWKVYRGSTIKDLELEWEAGQSFPRALMRGFRQGRHLNLLTIASIVVALVVVDGPLLQRSSSVKASQITQNIVQNMAISPELPTGFSGDLVPPDIFQLSSNTLNIMFDYTEGRPIRSTSSCEGSCAMKVHAPGLPAEDCFTKRWELNASMLVDPDSSWGSNFAGYMPPRPALYANIFAISPGTPLYERPGPEVAILIVGRLNVPDSSGGEWVETSCTLREAIVEYDIVVEGDEINFAAPPGSGKTIRHVENTFVDLSLNRTQPITWLGILTYLHAYVSTNTSAGAENPYPYPDARTVNELAMKYIGMTTRKRFDDGEIIMGDPTKDILNTLNEVMFLGGVLASWNNKTKGLETGLSLTQSVKANQTLDVNVYTSDLRWFAGAVAIQAVALVLILPVFYGWWWIGVRDFVLSPFRMAHIFDAPILRNVNSAAGVMEILRQTGDVHVRLGDVGPPQVHPAPGVNDPATTQPRYRKSRLGVAESYRVGWPYRGMEFGE